MQSTKAPLKRRFYKEVYMISKYLLIGTVVKPQGIYGQVKIKPLTDDPGRFLDLKEVLISRRKGEEQQPCAISQISVRQGFVYAALSGSDDRSKAEEQRGWMLYVRREDAVRLDEDQHFIADLIGCKVVDSKGCEVGVLREVLQPGANDVYVIDMKDGGSMMLPALLKAIPQVNIEKRLITINEDILDEVAVIEH